ncbi:DNA-binding response regulator, partial [Escherichia coli]|nr:DNA-binding response regulator [Escherichia coli]
MDFDLRGAMRIAVLDDDPAQTDFVS